MPLQPPSVCIGTPQLSLSMLRDGKAAHPQQAQPLLADHVPTLTCFGALCALEHASIIHLAPHSIHCAPPSMPMVAPHPLLHPPCPPGPFMPTLTPLLTPSTTPPRLSMPMLAPHPLHHPLHPLGCLCPRSHHGLRHLCPPHLHLHPMPPSVCVGTPCTIHTHALAICTHSIHAIHLRTIHIQD